MPAAQRPNRALVRFSIVSAVYDVAQYLPEFIASIDAQSFPLDQVEVIAVDDGSEDESLVLLKDWQQRRPGLVTVLQKENGGQGSARNLGLEIARGEWITFADPDDVLPPDYLQVVDAFLRRHSEVNLVATNRIFLIESTGEIVDRHPLRILFNDDKVVDLDRFPNYFHSAGNAAFYRMSIIRDAALAFDVRVRPIFEDGHFTVRYLLATEAPLVAFLGSAEYLYRRRTDGTSTLQTGLRHSGRFTAVPRYGYLDALRRGSAASGRAPRWLQNMILYELSWYFEQDKAMSGADTAAHGAVAVEFVQLLGEIADYLEPELIEAFGVRAFEREWREILLHGFSPIPWSTKYVVTQRYDAGNRQVRVAYRFVGTKPAETFYWRGLAVEPLHGKVRAHVYFEHALMYERIVWLPADGTVRVELDGRPVEVRRFWPGEISTSIRPARIASWFVAPSRDKRHLHRRLRSFRDAMIVRLSETALVRWKFGHAWVLVDRLHESQDNAERLFRYLRKNRRTINAWFVIERGTPDWHRLRRDGYWRVVPHGTLRWRLLMLNCEHLISSHADVQIDRPAEIIRLRPLQWKFTFLQHGVIKDDLSRWLNRKKIDLFVTTTTAEYASIAGDESPYALTSKEVRLTGLPRLDRLRALGTQFDSQMRNLVLICPTWRHWLNAPADAASHRRVVNEGFAHSDFARNWLQLLAHPSIEALASQRGRQIGFLLHPNMAGAVAQIAVPAHVQVFAYGTDDVQELIARAGVLVTDFSSIAFDAAYIERPVVYFHFDADRYLGGGHVARRGYFDYQNDGFGPVVHTVEDAALAVVRAMSVDSPRPDPTYVTRIYRTFSQRDGRCCERVVAAIEDLSGR